MTAAFTLRSATPSDTSGIVSLIAEVYAEYDCVLDTENDEPYLLDAGKHFRASGGDFWVVEGSEGIKGTVAVSLSPESGELKNLYVHRSLRGLGWGRYLVQTAIEHVQRAGKQGMVLWSDTRFSDAHRLYRKMGFAESGVRELDDINESVEYGFEKRFVE